MIYKHCYPFRLAAPSFVYPADYLTNVKRLGPCLDEIELLLFESNPQSLPSVNQVAELATLADALDISYNIHLPLDLDIATTDISHSQQTVARMAGIIELVRPLKGTTHTLHLPAPKTAIYAADRTAWQIRLRKSLETLLDITSLPPAAISIETLDYPPQWFAPVVEQLNLSVCVDVGHVICHGFDLAAILRELKPRITILHLHGVAGGKDHRSLNRLDPAAQRIVVDFLGTFRESLTLEVFSPRRLMGSMACLADLMKLRSSP